MHLSRNESINAVVIGAGSESIHAIRQARQLGMSVVALDGDPNARGLQYADESFVVDIRNHGAVFNILDGMRPKVVIPTPIGRYLTSVGAVNDKYHLCGVTYEAAVRCTDKHFFHTILSQRNVRRAAHLLFSNGKTDIPDSVDALEYPVIVKPRYGSGSRAVQVCMDKAELVDHFFSKRPFDEDYIIERFIEGTEYGVDAAIINDVLYLVLLREKLLTPFPYRQCVGYFSIARDDTGSGLFDRVEKSIKTAGNIMGFHNCLLHADIIVNNDEIFIIEMSARPSGHNLYNLFTPLVTGVDMISEYLKFALPKPGRGYSFAPKYTNNMLIKYFDLSEGRILRMPDKDYLYKHYPMRGFECNLKKEMTLQKVVDSRLLMERGYYIIEGKDKDELKLISDEIDRMYVLR